MYESARATGFARRDIAAKAHGGTRWHKAVRLPNNPFWCCVVAEFERLRRVQFAHSLAAPLAQNVGADQVVMIQ
jgi:hypothetical protein